MTITTLEPATIEDLDFHPGCSGMTTCYRNEGWRHHDCPSSAEIARIKKCGCITLHCMPCRNKIKKRIELEIAKLGWHPFWCVQCGADYPEVRSYWDFTLREVPL